MKKKLFIIPLLLTLGLSGCSFTFGNKTDDGSTVDPSGEVINVTGVELSNSSINISIGDTYVLNATVLPSNATNKEVLWSSTNTKVATVNNGLVTGVSEGSASIIVTTKDGNMSAICSVTVNKASDLPSNISVINLNKNNTPSEISSITTSGTYKVDSKYSYYYYGVSKTSNAHIKIDNAGYINNVDAIAGLKSITVTYARLSQYGELRLKTRDSLITSPAQGGEAITSSQTYTYTPDATENTFFSICASAGSFIIYSIKIEYQNDLTYVAPTRSGQTKIDINYINDIHGHAKYVNSSMPGIARLSTFFKWTEFYNPDGTLLLSGGDQYQGSAWSNMTYGVSMSNWMNEVGFDAQIVGNHEFDWGTEQLGETISNNRFPTLCTNVYTSDGSEQLDILSTSSMIVEKNGVNIGLIGSVGDCYSSISSSVKGNYIFKTGSEATELVKKESEALKANGADIIVYMVHSSGDADTTSALSGYVDIVFEGHTHTSYTNNDGLYHIQAGCYGQMVCSLSITYDFDNNSFSIGTPSLASASSNYGSKNYQDDAPTEELFNYYNDVVLDGAPDAVLATNFSGINKSSGYQYTADLYYKYFVDAANARLKALGINDTVTLAVNGSQFRSELPTSGTTVTYDDVYTSLPFDNDIAIASVSGSILTSRCLSGSYAHYPDISSSSISSSKTYYVITDSWNYAYSPNQMTKIETFTLSSLQSITTKPSSGFISTSTVGDFYKTNWVLESAKGYFFSRNVFYAAFKNGYTFA